MSKPTVSFTKAPRISLRKAGVTTADVIRNRVPSISYTKAA